MTSTVPVLTPPAVDPAAIRRTLRRLTARLDDFLAPLRDQARVVARRITEAANTPRAVAGVCATYRVRAALDPTYRSEDALGVLVRRIVRGTTDDRDVTLLTLDHRCELAVAAMGGWLLTHPAPTPAWDRTYSGTRIEFRPVYRYEHAV